MQPGSSERTLLLTRPRAQAEDWVARMAAQGVPTAVLPLIAIQPGMAPDAAVLAWRELPRAALAMFVSPNAVAAFFAAQPAGMAWPGATLAATVGPGSAQALRAAGVPVELIVQPPADAASFDSEHLWPMLAGRDWAGRLALILRGDGGRDWLAERLQERGAQVRQISVYRRVCPQLDPAERGLLDAALAAPERVVWLFSSSEAIGHLQQLAGPGAVWSRSLAIATHERIAERAKALGCGHVVLARPEPGAIAAALRSL